MSEQVEENSKIKKKLSVRAMLDYFMDHVSVPLLLLLLNSLAQGGREGIFRLQIQGAISKGKLEFCSPIIWSAYKRVDESTYFVALTALIFLFLLNWGVWMRNLPPVKVADSSHAKKTYGNFLLMSIGYYIVLAFIHFFKANNFLQSALPKCSLPLIQDRMEEAMLTGYNGLHWLIIGLSLVYVIVANLYLRRQFPRPNPWKKDDKIQA